MTVTYRNILIWFLYSLSIGLSSPNIIAKTHTFTHSINEDIFQFENGEFEEENIGAAFPNISYHRNGKVLKCVPLIKHFEVELNEPLTPGEGVGLTGDHIKLGEWQIEKSLEMKKRRRKPLKWFLRIPMCSALRIYYRFFIYYKDSRGFKRIRYWESQQHPRVLEAYEMYRHQGSLKFGEAHARAVGGGIQNEKGWLRNEYIIQLKFIWPQHIRFTEFGHFIRNPKYILKLWAFEEEKGQQGYKPLKSNEDTELQVSRFVSKKSKLRSLRYNGEIYNPGSIVIFHITAADFQENAYVLAIYTREQELLGQVLIPADNLKPSEGILELPIFDPKEHKRVGWLTLPFLRIECLPKALNFNMRAGFHHYWPYNWPTLDIGKRGLGQSFYYHSSNALENTIDSFKRAQEVNSDMIQLDVQLTKDYVPVVCHDFGFYTAASMSNRKLKVGDLEYVYIHDLTYQELLKKRVFMVLGSLMLELTYLNSVLVPERQRIFPQLAEVYQKLPKTLGIMVDIKWPQLLSSGNFESLQSLDKNRYVNEILDTTIEYGCGRPLLLASFDADICSMLRFKQPMFSVIFLTRGQFSPYESYADLRTYSLTNAIQYVQSSDILGTAVYAKEILSDQDNTVLDLAFELQQVVFVWGDILNDVLVQDYFRGLELAGLIYDHIDSFMSEKTKTKAKRLRLFEASELQRIFLRQCIAAGNVTISEGLPDTHSPFWPRLRSMDEL